MAVKVFILFIVNGITFWLFARGFRCNAQITIIRIHLRFVTSLQLESQVPMSQMNIEADALSMTVAKNWHWVLWTCIGFGGGGVARSQSACVSSCIDIHVAAQLGMEFRPIVWVPYWYYCSKNGNKCGWKSWPMANKWENRARKSGESDLQMPWHIHKPPHISKATWRTPPYNAGQENVFNKMFDFDFGNCSSSCNSVNPNFQ